ncbi:glycerophosphodiester phosphodiesterase [Halococcus hamelinensis]|uniref:Glycerophosphoryl diester phosphodiesterase n=1 Tax=Halococcus hamelinensis 100A6 TaxID=1132509 RepID=M0M5U8_9EURY|nr:glycerophosphodiester phosphodiesterase [Halococcus hamelinensis]EMA39755.1 glycerophosphoryl diester phosphodiesterase [Halococcus hamelinensis 100A6]
MERGSVERVPPATTQRSDDLLSIAHRGFAGIAPENTIAAMRAACGDSADGPGADMVEIDVQPAANGEPVVFHDLTLGRLTDVPPADRRRRVSETPLETLRNYSVLGSDERVATFAEVLDALPADVGVNVELKHPGTGQPRRELDPRDRSRGRDRWSPLVERVVRALDDHRNAALVSSSYEGALAAMRDVAPETPLAYLFWNSIEAGLAVTERYDCEAVHPSLDMVRGTDLFNSGYVPTGPFVDVDLVERAHETGRPVNVWTVTDWHQASQLRAAGVDGLIADYPGLTRATPPRTATDAGRSAPDASAAMSND